MASESNFEERFVCPNKCGRSYKYKGGLHIHLKEECGVLVPKYAYLTNWFACSNVCGQECKYKGSLSSHIPDKCCVLSKYSCSICLEDFKQENVLPLENLNDKWTCPHTCGRSYKNKHSLASHLKYECGVKPQFSCQNCSRTFKLKHHLKSHMMSCGSVFHDSEF
ncbi:gastrula zinc finger protein XlCGF8.2DB-like [Adelges cooleyi]|uniref:gastrula zinc finger protein XlCGF8.2DB-like n=1 Tax=Adelges cooleyi TaxID=133065 RepID=UPI00218012B9|nr:gastrula zinc finger protein XlCGF8.2DB-like [Adelges cooleyi]